MKKLLIGLAVVVVLLLAVVVAAPFVAPLLISVDTYKEQIAQAAKDATGRELVIAGDLELSFLPRLEIEARDVSFANAAGASEPEMVSLDQLLIQLQILPLLLGEVKVDSFVLVQPVIHLEVDKNGRANWQFQGGPADEASAGETQESSGGAPELAELSLGDVRLERGKLTYADAQTGRTEELSDINMALSLLNMESPFGAEGSVVWNGEQVTLIIEGDQLRSLVEGDATPLKMSIESRPLNLAYDGRVIAGDIPKVAGRVDLNVPSIRELADWTGNPLETGGGGLNLLTIKGQVTVTGPEYAFTSAEIELDNMFATGDFSADTGGAKVYAKGRLDVDQLDLNTYLPPEGAGIADEPTVPEGEPTWSTEPIDLSGLAGINADFDLTVGAIKVREIKIDRSALSLSLKDGVLVTDLTELRLYGGQGKGRIELDGSGSVPAVEQSFSIKGVRASPLLMDLAKFPDMEGTGDLEISVKAQGVNQDAMVKSMNGEGNFKFLDGAITGFNLAAMARDVKSAFQNPKADRTQKTDFAELSATFDIQDGTLSNNDLLLLNPLLRARGSGTANMPKRTLDYRFVPKLVGSIEGQGSSADEGGVSVPILVKGPWHAIRFQPDVEGIVSDVVEDPGKALEGAEGTLKKLKKGSKKIDPKKELKKLLGD